MNDFFTSSISKFNGVLTTIAIFFVVLGTIFFIAGKFQGKIARYLAIVIFVGPAVLLVLTGIVISGIQTILFSFMGPDSLSFIGLNNYRWMLSDPSIAIMMRNTLLWLLFAPIFTTVLGLTMAILLNQMRRESIPKSILFMPMAISFVGASIIWKFIYDFRSNGTQIGLLNAIWTHLGGDPVNWILNKPLNTFLLMVILVVIYQLVLS